jgi:hypothetical protein
MTSRFLTLAAGCGMAIAASAVAAPQAARIRLANANTGETFRGTYRSDDGPIDRVMKALHLSARSSLGRTDADGCRCDRLSADVLDAVSGPARRSFRLPDGRDPRARRTTFSGRAQSAHLGAHSTAARLENHRSDECRSGDTAPGGVGVPAFGFHPS